MSSYNYNLGHVVAFDLLTEKFKMIEHPKIFMQGNGEWPFLGELKGHLCLLDSKPLMPHMMQLWVLDNRETLEWVVVNICHGFERPQMAFPVFSWRNGVLFQMRWNGRDQVVIYDSQSNSFGLISLRPDIEEFCLYPYVESLVTIKRKLRKRWNCRRRRCRISSE